MLASERAEIAATRDLFEAAPADVRARGGIRHAEVAGALCIAVEGFRDILMFNRVLGLGLESAAGEAELDAVAAFFAGSRTRYAVQVVDAGDAGLGGRLAARGFTQGYAWMKFERRAAHAPAVQTDLRVEEVDARHGAAFGQAVAAGFELGELCAGWAAALPGRDGWHCFVAFDGEAPVATGVLHVAGDTGWLGLGATLPDHRGRGGQSALLAERIRRAEALGCRLLVTETGERVAERPSGSYRNILRSGFAEAYLRPNLVSPPSA